MEGKSAERRIKSARRRFSKHGLDSFLVTNLVNIRYLLNRPQLFDSHFNGALLLTEVEALLLADFRYHELAVEADLGTEIILQKEPLIDVVAGLADAKSLKKLGVEAGHLPTAKFLKLEGKLGERVSPRADLIEGLRVIKDEAEIKAIAAAAAMADRIFERLLEALRPRVTEKEVAFELEFMLRRLGAEDVSFKPIVASGPNSAIPHAQATNRKLQANQFVKLDYGCVYRGYCSDLTRTVFLGKASNEHRRLYNLVKEAQQLALDGLRVGMTGKDADAVARDFFEQQSVADKFGHNLGHGVGLEVHEPPTLGPKSDQVLGENMVFTVEPGLYVPGFGGVRIEDMVVLRESGIEILTKTPKELVEV